jgi:hypothetical protein
MDLKEIGTEGIEMELAQKLGISGVQLPRSTSKEIKLSL